MKLKATYRHEFRLGRWYLSIDWWRMVHMRSWAVQWAGDFGVRFFSVQFGALQLWVSYA